MAEDAPLPLAERSEAGDIAYRLRLSRRARRLQLHVSPYGEVEVVLPQDMDPRLVPPFVARHRNWILRTRARLMSDRPQPAAATTVPTHIHLHAIDAHWIVDFKLAHKARLRESPGEAGGSLALRAADEGEACHLLQRWLGHQGRLHLVPWLQAVAAETGLSYGRVSVRGQRSRWGSYSSRGTLSINRALLFLAPALVRHLFIHELCHSVYMNHSTRYWRLVERHSPRYRELERALNRAVAEIPRWAVARV